MKIHPSAVAITAALIVASVLLAPSRAPRRGRRSMTAAS